VGDAAGKRGKEKRSCSNRGKNIRIKIVKNQLTEGWSFVAIIGDFCFATSKFTLLLGNSQVRNHYAT
jgi:hypothetical protein